MINESGLPPAVQISRSLQTPRNLPLSNKVRYELTVGIRSFTLVPLDPRLLDALNANDIDRSLRGRSLSVRVPRRR